MPNWCNNMLRVHGSQEAVEAFDKAFLGSSAVWPLAEYEKHGKTEEQIAEIEQRQREQEPQYCFNALYPVPEEVLKVGFSVETQPDMTKPVEEWIALRMSKLEDPEQWEDGYSWCISHWGTKWDVYEHVSVEQLLVDPDDEERLKYEYRFDTAWSPPIPWLEKVAADWPKLNFELLFCEGGLGFAGRYVCENGVVTLAEEVEGYEYREFVMKHFDYDLFEEVRI